MSTITDDLDLDELDELSTGTDDDSDLVRRLRGQLKSATKRLKQVDDLEAENRTLKLGSLIGQADLGDLKEAQRETLADWAAKQTDVTPDLLRDRAVALGWAEAKEDPAEREIDAHDEIAAATSGAKPKGGHQITPADAGSWPADKRLRFREQYPSEFEALLRGETVSGVTW